MTELIITPDKDIDGAPTLKIGDRILVQEMACSYKSVKASQLITEVIEKVDLAGILNKLASAQEVDEEVRRLIIKARDLQEEILEIEEKLATNSVRKKDRDFLDATLQKKKDLRLDILADATGRQGDGRLNTFALAAEVLPIVFEQAPDIIWSFDALMMVPNNELMELFGKPNGIAERINDEKKWLQFGTKQFEPLDIAAFFLPAVGFDMLKKAGETLVWTAMEILTTPEPTEEQVDTQESSKSSSPNSQESD